MILTDEEILKATGWDYLSGDELILIRQANEAQLKKVGEWIDSFNDKPVGEEVRYFINRFRQSLLDEVK